MKISKYDKEREENRKTGEVKLILSTLCPSKYVVFDLETGNVWSYRPPSARPKYYENYEWWTAKIEDLWKVLKILKRILRDKKI